MFQTMDVESVPPLRRLIQAAAKPIEYYIKLTAFTIFRANAPTRVVNLVGPDGALDLENLQSDKGAYVGWAAYAQAKAAVKLFTQEPGRRLTVKS